MATKVNGLIQKVNPGNNTQYSIASTAYGYCETAAATAAKVVDMTGFTLLEGTTIHVKFKENNTAASPTLNVNGTGAKSIVQYGTTAASTSDATTGWYAGAVVSFTYDGTSWVRDQGFNTDTDTHYTTHLYAGDGTAANKATTNGNTKISVTDNTTVRNSVTIKGTGTTSVTSDANGVITINSADSKTGTVTSITPGNGLLNGTTTNAITTSGTLNINYGTTTAKIGTAAAGSATTVSRSDHVHSIALDTGDSNGQVKIAGTNVSVKGLGSNAYTSTAYLPLAGGILTNTDNVTYTANTGAQIKVNPISILQSPVPKYLWHDLWAFCRATTPKYYTSTNGTSWTEATLNKTIFSHRENISPIDILGTNLTGSRWEWIGGGYAYCSGAWLLIGVAYANPIAKFDVLLEASSGSGDNATWTTLCNVTGVSQNSAPIWIKTTGPSDNNIRLTITRNSGSATDTRLPIVALRWLTSRWGDQGKGSEWELPFTWDNNNNISPLSGGSFSGNATSASAVKDYNNNTLTKFGYSTSGMTSTSWLGSWDASTSGEYRLRAISPANAIKSGIGTTAIGKASLPVYWNGSEFATITSYEGKAATAGAADTATTATSAGKWTTARTLTIGNKGQSVDGSQDVSWTLHDILNGSQIGTSTTWQQYNPGVYYVASNAAFTGEGNPENANGGLTPYRYGQLIVSRAGNGGVAQFYISHNDSGSSSYGIKYRSGWNNTYNAKWDTLLDSTNYTNYTVTKTGSGASGSWGISITGSSASCTGNAATATKFASNQSVALTGDVTGSASSQAGWSIATTLANSGVTADTYGNTSQQTPSHGGTFNIPYFKVDAKGRVTQAGTTTVKLPADNNTDTKVTQNNVTASNDYRVLLSTSANDTAETNTVNKNTNLRYNPSTNTLSTGNITGTGNLDITGNTNLNGETYAESITAGSLLVNGNANFVQSPTAPTPVATSNDTTIATTAFVMNAFTANDAMIFKGVVNANGNLPATHKQGWTYRVATAGTYAGKVCEVGDIIICVTDGTAANNDHWAVIQNNIDGAVTGPASATTNAIARYNGTTGKIIKNSNVTIDDTGNITTPGNINLSTGGANIVWNSDTWQQRIKTTDDSTADTPVFTFQQSSNSGSAWTDLMTIKDNGKVVATTFVGALDGNASTATKATQDESGNNIKASYASSFSISGHTITLQNKNGASLGTVTVPDNDTKNTAGSTDTSNKIYLIGATSQADNPQTYSDNEVYVQNGTLYAVKTADLSGTANNKPALIVGGADTSTHMEIDANEIQAKTNGTSVAQLYINNDGGLVTVGSGGLAITSLTASQAVSTDANKKLVSTNLTVSDPTASGTGITYIATISQSATGKITATKSTVRSASTSQTGVTQYTADNLNTWINQLGTGSSTPTDADYYISQYVGGGTTTTTYHRRPMSALWEYIKGKITAGTYWANIKISDAAKYNTAPEMATLKLNGNTSATAASTSNVTLVYNTTSQALNFVFA